MLELLLQKVTEQGAILKEQGATLKEQGTILKDHSAILKEQGATLKEQGTILKDHSAILKEQGTALKDHSSILNDHSEILQALRHGQEVQKAEIDRINVTLAHIQGEQGKIKEIIHNLAGDISFLVRKAAQHDDDIRELKRIK